MTDLTYDQIQKFEADSWLIEDDAKRKEKAQREFIRYPLLKRQMGLDFLDTSDFVIFDVGCGPVGGVSSIMHSKITQRFDPLIDEYKKYFPQENATATKAEDLEAKLGEADLIIVTNALDHFENPEKFLSDLPKYMKPGAYFAQLHAVDNAITHPWEGHQHNINPDMIHKHLDQDFETVWELTYDDDGLRYGWVKFKDKVGQPAFSGLYRKVTGYQ